MIVYDSILEDCLITCKGNGYKGWDKYDGTLSPLLEKKFFNNYYFRFILQQVIKESPINLRNLFKIPQNINNKALALILKSYFLYDYKKNSDECNKIVEILHNHKSKSSENMSWGYNFAWQTQTGNITSDQSNVTVTFFVSEAIVTAYKNDNNEKYAYILHSIFKFFSESIYVMLEDEKWLAYSYFIFPQKNIVYNIQAMIATFYLNYGKLFDNQEAIKKAHKLFNYIKSQMNDNYTWNYHNGKGYNKIDNYHSAYILDSFWELFIYTKSDEDLEFYFKCLKSYEEKFFGSKGEPYWSLKYKYPYDIHSAANGIISFAKASSIDKKYIDKSKLILNWTINNMYRKNEQDFIYRIFGPLKYNYSFLRWGNAWMCYAISEYLYFANKLQSVNNP